MQETLEINFKQYISVIGKNWILIACIAVVSSLGALFYSMSTPTVYGSTALIAIYPPKYVMNFDPNIQSIPSSITNYNAYPGLALSDEVVADIYQNWKNRPNNVEKIDDLRKLLSVSNRLDPSLLELTVESSDPKESADLANLWASIFVSKARAIYGGQSQTQVTFFQSQLDASTKKLQDAEQALIEFEGRDQTKVLQNQLNSLFQRQNDYLQRERDIQYLTQSMHALKSKLQTQVSQDPANFADQLSALDIQFRILNFQGANQSNITDTSSNVNNNTNTVTSIGPSTQTNLPIQVQLTNPDAFGKVSNQELLDTLDHLETELNGETQDIEKSFSDLTPQINNLQKSIQRYMAEGDQLKNTVDINKETQTTLAKQFQQTQISAQDNNGTVQIATNATISDIPLSKNIARNLALSGVAGVLLGFVFVLLKDWWQGSGLRDRA